MVATTIIGQADDTISSESWFRRTGTAQGTVPGLASARLMTLKRVARRQLVGQMLNCAHRPHTSSFLLAILELQTDKAVTVLLLSKGAHSHQTTFSPAASRTMNRTNMVSRCMPEPRRVMHLASVQETSRERTNHHESRHETQALHFPASTQQCCNNCGTRPAVPHT
jgi:hypothetical protein